MDDIDLNELKDRFTRRVFDERLSDALPIVQRAYEQRKSAVGEEFEAWANSLIDDDNEDGEESPLSNDLDNNAGNVDIEELLDKNDFTYRVQDGKYSFESGEELERAKDIIAAFDPDMKFPPMGVYDQNDTYGATTNDFELNGYTAGVMEDTMGLQDPEVVIYDNTGKYLDKLNLSAAAAKYNLDADSVKQQLQNQDMTKVGNLTISTPISGQSVDENFNGISVNIEPELDYDVVQVMINGKKYDFNYWYTDEKPITEIEFRKDIPQYLEREEWYNRLDFPTKMEVLHAVVQAELGNEPSEYKPTVDDEPLDEVNELSLIKHLAGLTK